VTPAPNKKISTNSEPNDARQHTILTLAIYSNNLASG